MNRVSVEITSVGRPISAAGIKKIPPKPTRFEILCLSAQAKLNSHCCDG